LLILLSGGCIAAGNAEEALAEDIAIHPLLQTPQLYVSLQAEGLPPQRFRAAQLATRWEFTDADGYLRGFCASSDHPLDFWIFDLWDTSGLTLYIADGTDGELEIEFSGGFPPPDSMYIRRWDAAFAVSVNDGGSDMELWFQYESVEADGSQIRVSADSNDFIYEVEAIWPQGRSTYTFRIDRVRDS